jgi:hypothetical protein
LSTTNPAWTDPGANQDLRGERPTINPLSHCKATYAVKSVVKKSKRKRLRYNLGIIFGRAE